MPCDDRVIYMIKALLFDADGVIVRSEMFSHQYTKKFGIPTDAMTPFFKGIFQSCLIGETNLKEVVEPYLQKWKWHGTVDEFLNFWFESEHVIDQQVVAAIKTLKNNGVRCFLTTNQEQYRTDYMRHTMGFGELFDGIFSSAEVRNKKPEPDYYEFVIQVLQAQHGIEKNAIIYIDHTVPNIEGATAVGIKSYLYTEFDAFKQYLSEQHLHV
ncbi:MAG: hypothetical protein COU35_03120 [Candidatus Magasanikbacteria bacterium CG10_big_fil_rev_8_21_14_0_10_47_10]|uniref:HAD family phosphatase n=1 Tax=Candidatus Magasanikbacteria bacterium CG10_big_fil_rev_8_21_14_0_10_47_10 TaxID=1974652 RepID=A0A2H0TQ27_9BACT|nr:MAG: hypothetical protein COU35_03120 [Candidatus Magasanikbacteria bacterium CG10_big_fil_rev_8_21_14_0_10_47_10]